MTDVSAPTRPIGVVAHYNLLERLEPEGPGDLYRARDTRLGRTVTIRSLPADFTPDAESRAALIEQARAIIPLSHPNVITLFDAGEEGGRVYLVFEFLKGQSLRGEMAGRPMKVRRALELAAQMADAVAAGHASGYVHGGLSPDSVVITVKGHAKIPAFELASRSGFEPVEGESGTGVHLRDYDSPEEAGGQHADDRSDIYSVGAMFYEMLTTRRPSHRGAAAPSAANAQVPEEVDRIALKAVAPNRELRYGSAATLASELRTAAATLELPGDWPDESHPATHSTSVGRVAGMSLIIAALLGLAAWLLLTN